jgi:hypothetical protein
MCEQCEYMRGYDGMNIGGISALFNYILVDASAKVGLKAKVPLGQAEPKRKSSG